MARGIQSNDSNLQLFFMKITGLKPNEAVRIEQTKAGEDGKHVKLDESVPDVSGQLHKIEVREYEPRAGEKAKELKIWLKDTEAGEMYALGCNLNSIGRSIINTLLNLQEPFGTLMIRVYNRRDNGFPSVFMTHNDAKIGWKYSFDELKKYIVESTVRENGQTKVKKDYYDLNEFLIKELNETIVPKLSKVPEKFQDQQKPNNEATPPVDDLIPDTPLTGDDDLPF